MVVEPSAYCCGCGELHCNWRLVENENYFDYNCLASINNSDFGSDKKNSIYTPRVRSPYLEWGHRGFWNKRLFNDRIGLRWEKRVTRVSLPILMARLQ